MKKIVNIQYEFQTNLIKMLVSPSRQLFCLHWLRTISFFTGGMSTCPILFTEIMIFWCAAVKVYISIMKQFYRAIKHNLWFYVLSHQSVLFKQRFNFFWLFLIKSFEKDNWLQFIAEKDWALIELISLILIYFHKARFEHCKD